MKNLKNKIVTGALIAATVAAASGAAVIPAFAQSATSTRSANSALNQAKRLQALGARGSQEVDVRVDSLNKLITRIQSLRNVSDSQKGQIITTIQALITNLTTLKTEISGEASTTALKSEVQQITANYRVYALAIPQLNIYAASDREITIVNMMTAIGAKLQTRLSQASGVTNLTALQADLTDFGAKITDANTQAQAAVNEVSQLVPDEGDKTKMASNTAALKDARAKLKVAQQDLTTARKDAKTIIDALVKSDKSVMTTTSSTTTTQ